jgi:hypothetical protein
VFAVAASFRIRRTIEDAGTLLILGPALAFMGACGGRRLLEAGMLTDASSDRSPDAVSTPRGAAIGTTTAPDCPGCTFPSPAAAPCASSAPPIKLVYPPDTALLPPNLGVFSVQWVPFGAPFARFEVDFSQSATEPVTDWRIVTACATQTADAQDAGSGGCELAVDPDSWSRLAAANRGGSPIAITVRGTTDGACASTSADTVNVSIAEEDVLGTYFHWKSNTTLIGTGGQVWAKTFGDATTPEQNVSSAAFPGPLLCAGCHSLARDGSRMLVFPVDDTDADYGGLGATYFDLTPWPASPPIELTGRDGGTSGGQPPGFTALAPAAAYYVTSNGLPCTVSGGSCGESDGYPSTVPANAFSLWNGQTGAFVGPVSMGAPGTRPTMPDWSIDGTSVVYVQPSAVGSWDSAARSDDEHIFGGSLNRASYTGGGTFGAPTVLVASQGENNYYPSYSPDVPASFVLFDRAPIDMSVTTLTGCMGVIPKATCPNDSFSNPAARLMLVANAPGATPIDLEKANGSPAGVKARLANSYPRWAPFAQTYKGKKLFWVTFSSTRNYGLRILNDKTGMYPCYPPDSLEWPGSSHHNVMASTCQQPQLWMAPVFVSAQAAASDPSGVAFWIPYQDMTTHNHMAEWTWTPQSGQSDGGAPSCSCSTSGGPCGAANGGCGCCSGLNLVCSGDQQCILPPK